MPGRRSRLRAAVGDVHARLDCAIGRCFANAVDYRIYVNASFRARRQLETALARLDLPAPFPAAADYGLGDALARDLADLDIAVARDVDDGAPAQVRFDRPGAWGVAYVLAGASLGAVHLQRRAAALGFSPHYGARHLARQVERARHWRAFVECLDGEVMTPGQDVRCLDGARVAFAVYDACFGVNALD
jgi:heme oxygenase